MKVHQLQAHFGVMVHMLYATASLKPSISCDPLVHCKGASLVSHLKGAEDQWLLVLLSSPVRQPETRQDLVEDMQWGLQAMAQRISVDAQSS